MQHAARGRWSPGVGVSLLLSLVAHALVAVAIWVVPLRPERTATPLPTASTWTLLDVPDPTSSAEEQDVPVRLLPPLLPPTAVVAVGPSVEPDASTSSTPAGSATETSPQQVGSDIPAGGGYSTSANAQSPRFFDVETRAASVVYVIDRSASIGETGGLARARAELRLSLQHLPVTARFQVLLYNRRVEPLGPEPDLVEASTENVRRALTLLAAVEAEGGTDHEPALRLALKLQPDVIFFLTDADDLRPELVKVITHLNAGRSVIHTFELQAGNRDRIDLPLHQLARDNRGSYRALP